MKMFLPMVFFCFSTLIFPQSDSTGNSARPEKPQENIAEKEGDLTDTASANISIGASFNFIEGLKVNDFYGDVVLFLPKVWNLHNWLNIKYLGLMVGISQGRSFTADSSNDKISVNDIKNFTVFFSSTLYMFDHVYLILPYVDVRKADINAVEKVIPASGNPETILAEKNISYYKTTVGAGPFISMYSQPIGIIFMMRILLGVAFHRDALRDNPWQHIAPFALLAPFDIKFSKIGLKLGGELRWEYVNEYGEFLIYLAKEFSIDKLFEFLKK